MSKAADRIRTFVDNNPDMTQAQVAKKLGVSDRTVRRALADKSGQKSGQMSGQKADIVSGFEADKKADKCPVPVANTVAVAIVRAPRPRSAIPGKQTREEYEQEASYIHDLAEAERATPGTAAFCEAEDNYFGSKTAGKLDRLRDELASELLRKPNQKCLDLLDKFPDLTVTAILAAKHAFFTGNIRDAQELECTPAEYDIGYAMYLEESIAAKAPWCKVK